MPWGRSSWVHQTHSGQLWTVECGQLNVRTENRIFRVSRLVCGQVERNFGRQCGMHWVSSRDMPIRACLRMMNSCYPGLHLPSLSPSQQGSAPTSVFSFIESEVHTNLAHMPEAVREGVLQLLRTYEPTVFESRKLPRLAPRRGLDMDIAEYSGARPVTRRSYPVTPQHKAESMVELTESIGSWTYC